METKDLILNGKPVLADDITQMARCLSPYDDQGQNSGDSTNQHRGVCLYTKWGSGAEEMAKMVATLLSKYDVNSKVIKSSLGSCAVHMNIENPKDITQLFALVQRIKSAIFKVHAVKNNKRL